MKKFIFYAIVSIIIGLFKGPLVGVSTFVFLASFFFALGRLIEKLYETGCLLQATRRHRTSVNDQIYGKRSFWNDYRLVRDGCSPTGAIPKTLDERREARWTLIEEWISDIRTAYSGEIISWKWMRYNIDNEIILRIGDVFYVGEVEFYDESDPKHMDQPRVKRFTGHVEGTDEPFALPGKDEVVVSDASIEKNIINAFKNDKDLIRAVAEAHDQCLTKGEGSIDTLPLDLDCSGARKMNIFGKVCIEQGGFSNAHVQKDGHTLSVFMDMDGDPIGI